MALSIGACGSSEPFHGYIDEVYKNTISSLF